MALATKCPHCNTIFRVAHDQLKLRGGIVRCGSCNQVFDGNAALLEPLAPPAAIPTALTPAAAEPSEFDLDFGDLDDAALPPLPVMAEVNLPDSVAALSLDFDDEAGTAAAEPAPQPLPAQWRVRPPEPPAAPISLTKPEPEPLRDRSEERRVGKECPV